MSRECGPGLLQFFQRESVIAPKKGQPSGKKVMQSLVWSLPRGLGGGGLSQDGGQFVW
jgi:hypothetical protein